MKKSALLIALILVVLGSCDKGPINGGRSVAYLKHNTYVTSNNNPGSSGMPDLVVTKNGLEQPELLGRVFCSQQSYDLIAGQTMAAGLVIVSNDQENLLITYQAENGWKIRDIHLYAGTLEMLPVNEHNVPVPGQFPIQESFDPEVEYVTYEIPLESLEECFYIAAHAVVVKDGNEETAWGKGDFSFEEDLGVSRWGWLIETCPDKCEGEELVVAVKSYVSDQDLCTDQSCDPVYWVVSNGTGTAENCLGIGFNKFRTDDTEARVFNLIKWGNPEDVKGTISVSNYIANDSKYLKIEVTLKDEELLENMKLSKSYLYVGTEDGLGAYYYKYKGKDCYTFYNWFFQKTLMGDTHTFDIPLEDITEK